MLSPNEHGIYYSRPARGCRADLELQRRASASTAGRLGHGRVQADIFTTF